jgi:hypothetical protein
MEPLPEQACPLCGGPNHCAVAAAGTFSARCWCQDVAFPPELLARIPDEQRGKACLCPACAGAAGADSAPGPG